MTNQEVFAAFANRQPARGGSVHVERTPRGVVLYSYATPIAYLRDGEDVPVFTKRRFSVTTSKQQSQARRAFDGQVQHVEDHIFRLYAKEIGASFALAR